jgi:hypothetical protein
METILTNPITNSIKELAGIGTKQLLIAVPFISDFASKLWPSTILLNIGDKRLITRFDETNITTFELATLKNLIQNGFKIRYCNNIHLKLYQNENEAIITSSNLTKGGLEDNFELSVKVIDERVKDCLRIFLELWNRNQNEITLELIELNWDKYLLLKKREALKKRGINIVVKSEPVKLGSLDIEQLFNAIVNQNMNYSFQNNIALSANIRRNQVLKRIIEGFDTLILYAPENHPLRRDNLFYDFVYGYEKDMAGTGLREQQFKDAFTHNDFKSVIWFMLPESKGMAAWNLSDPEEYFQFCNGIFEFNIPQYSEAIPIRLASYFYRESFVPIFILNHLQKICESLGLSTDAETKGERLFAYNSFLEQKMRTFPYPNHIKAHLIYQLLYTIKLYERLQNEEAFEDIIKDFGKAWEQGLIEHGRKLLRRMKVIEG